jgi:CRISP-associated protein Cas1
MLKRCIFIESECYLSVVSTQLKLSYPDNVKEVVTVPIEDIGTLILDHPRITISMPLLQELADNNVATVICDSRHFPMGMFLNLAGHSLQTQKTRFQLDASLPLKKQLWMQTVKAKIINQATVLRLAGQNFEPLLYWAKQVKTGDTEGVEAKAAAFYWKNLFENYYPEFKRDQFGFPPNNALNYTYSILRSLVARHLVGSGLHPGLGIFHRNQYNAFCLADDIMEPYRPFADWIVFREVQSGRDLNELDRSLKKDLLNVVFMDLYQDKKRSPLQVALGRTTASLAQCFEGTRRQLLYPVFSNSIDA